MVGLDINARFYIYCASVTTFLYKTDVIVESYFCLCLNSFSLNLERIMR